METKNIKQINIAICGSFSVGKTTLANYIFKHLLNKYSISLSNEVALNLINKGFLMSKDITEYGITNYALLSLQNIRNRGGQIYLSDRSLIDLYSYLLINKSTKIRESYIKLIEELLYHEDKIFDLYVYIPIEIPLENIYYRVDDDDYRNQVDNKIIELLTKYNKNYITVRGSVEERFQTVINEIKKYNI